MSSKSLTPEQVRELQPLREVIARQFGQPVMPTAEGFSDLVDRVTVAVAAYMGGQVPRTPQEARDLASAMERTAEMQVGVITGPPELLAKITRCPECGEPYGRVLVGTPDEGLSCTHKSGCTWVWTRPPDQWFPGAGSPESPHGPTVDGILPHRPVTPKEDAWIRRLAEQWEAQNPMTPERAAAMLAGHRSPTSCLGCGQPWIDAVINHRNGCPVIPRQECPVVGVHDPHVWRGDQVPYQCPGVEPDGCPGCGQLPTDGRHGRAIRHPATCTVTGNRVPLADAAPEQP